MRWSDCVGLFRFCLHGLRGLMFSHALVQTCWSDGINACVLIFRYHNWTSHYRMRSQQSTDSDQKSLETEFSIAICPVGRQMTIESSISNNCWSTFIDSINVFDCRLSGVFDLFRYTRLNTRRKENAFLTIDFIISQWHLHLNKVKVRIKSRI